MCAWPTRASASARRRRRDSYLNVPAILSAAAITGADAIHPGYGFLAENASLRRDGGSARPDLHRPVGRRISRMMGDKIAAKAAMASLGVPLVPGSEGALGRPRRGAPGGRGRSAIRC